MNNHTWYAPKTDISSPDTIHQILMYGTLNEISTLIKKQGIEKVKKVFVKFPKKIYTNSAFNFIKNFILEINKPVLDEQKYLKSSPRNIR
jgi:hypothetical protein